MLDYFVNCYKVCLLLVLSRTYPCARVVCVCGCVVYILYCIQSAKTARYLMCVILVY